MTQQYGKEKGEQVFWSTVNKRGLDETKSMKDQKKEEYAPGPNIEPPFKPKEEAADIVRKAEEAIKSAFKSIENKEEFSTKGVTMGNDKFKPWYMDNRPMGAPRSPDQEKTAQSFKNATDEIQAVWNEMESGKSAKDKGDKIEAFLADSKPNSAFLQKFKPKK